MSKSNEIAQVEDINKALTSLNSTLSTLSETYLKIVKDIADSNKPIKDAAVSMESLAKAQKQSTDEGKKLDALGKQLIASEQKLKDTEDSRLKTIVANRIATQERTKALKDEVNAEKAASGSLNAMRLELIKLKNEYAAASKEIREKMAPAINKLNDEVLKSEKAIGVHQRNVGNYPDLTKKMAGGFSDVTSAIGGTTGEIGNAVAGMAVAGGAAGVFTAVIAGLAAAWKYANESVKLYLESADKALYGGSGFNQDAKAAMEDAAKRAKGGIIEGRRLEADAKNRLLLMQNITDEDKAQLQLQISEGQQMQKDNQLLLDSTGKNKEIGISLRKQLEWKLAYRTLLKEEEILNDEKLAKETEWEELEARLVQQRAIVSDIESTVAQKKQAALDADVIAGKLVKDKTDFLDRQLANLNAIAEMTGKQEVVEDQVNGLLKERNTIQKEYYSDQVKINKLERTSAKDTTKSIEDAKKAREDAIENELKLRDVKIKVANDIDKEGENAIEDEIKRHQKEVEQEQKWELDAINEGNDRELDALYEKNKKEIDAEEKAADKKKEIAERIRDMQLQLASESINGIFNLNAAKLSNEMQTLEKEKDMKLSNKRLTEAQKEKIEAEYEKKANAVRTKQAKADKLQSLFNIALSTAEGSMKAVAESPLTGGMPFLAWVLSMGMLQAGLVAAQPIPKYAKGTQSAGQRGIFGEAGRELMFTRSGDVMLADRPTYFEGNKFKGAQIFSNPETEKMISMTDRKSGNYQVSNQGLINELREVKKAILSKPIAIVDKGNRIIGQGTSNSQTVYLNRLMRN